MRRLPFLLMLVHGHASGPDGDQHKQTPDHRQSLGGERGGGVKPGCIVWKGKMGMGGEGASWHTDFHKKNTDKAGLRDDLTQRLTRSERRKD